MAKKDYNAFGNIRVTLDNIKKLNGTRYIVRTTIEDNGGVDNNPAKYGTYLEDFSGEGILYNRDYRFLSPALKDFKTEMVHSKDMDEYLSIFKVDGKRRGKKEMLKAAEYYGQAAVDRVRQYILYEAPQYPERKRKNPSLIDTGNLYDSIKYEIYDKKNNLLSEGK